MKFLNTKPSQGKDTLLGTGWSVSLICLVSGVDVSEPGICMASVSGANKAITELTGEKPLAFLCPANIDAMGE